MPDKLFGLGFAQGLDRFPVAAPDDPELQRILYRARQPKDEVLTPPKDPYEGKGFGGQFLQSLKDDLTGGDQRRQRNYDNQARAVAAANDAARLGYQKRGLDQEDVSLGYQGRQTAVAEQNSAVAKQRADDVRKAIADLPTREKQIMAILHPEAMEDADFLTEGQYQRKHLVIANVKRQAENLAFGGPGWLRGPFGTSLEQDFGEGQQQQTPSRSGLIPGLRSMSALSPTAQSQGPSPSQPTFLAEPPRKKLAGSMIPITSASSGTNVRPMTFGGQGTPGQVTGQRVNPFDPNDKRMMVGNVTGDPNGGQLQREIAKATALTGPRGINTVGNIEQDRLLYHPDTRGELSANQQLLGYARLQGDWDNASKNYREMKRQESLMNAGMIAARDRGDLAQGAQAVLVTFQKILDPTSVVRESEYARSAAGLSAMAQMEGFVQKLAEGGAGVPLDELEKYATLAKEFLHSADSGLMGHRQRLEDTAKEFKLNPNLIFDSDAGKPAFTRPGPNGKTIPFNSQEEVDIYDRKVAAEQARIKAGGS